MDFSLVEMAIKSGIFDDKLDALVSLVQQRRQRIADQILDEIVIGDTIVLSHRVRPQYLGGTSWRVVGYPTGTKSNKFDLVVEPLDYNGRRYLKHGGSMLIAKTLVARKV